MASRGSEQAATALSAVYSCSRTNPIWAEPQLLEQLRQISLKLSATAEAHLQAILYRKDIPEYSSMEQYCYDVDLPPGTQVKLYS